MNAGVSSEVGVVQRGWVNLAGRSVDCVKTRNHEDEILGSRVEAPRAGASDAFDRVPLAGKPFRIGTDALPGTAD